MMFEATQPKETHTTITRTILIKETQTISIKTEMYI